MKLLKPTTEIVTILERASRWIKEMHEDGNHHQVRIALSLLLSDIMDRNAVSGVESSLTNAVYLGFSALLDLHTFEGEVKDDA